MAIQRWTIVKIGGQAAVPLRKKLRRWLAISRIVAETESCKWKSAELAAMRRMVQSLRSHAMELPILYFSEHVDMWSVGGCCFDYIVKEYIGAEYSIGWIELPEQRNLVRTLKAQLRKKRLTQEDRWFLSSVLNAIDAWEGLVSKSLVVVVRESITVSPMDKEVLAACGITPKWLR